MFLFLKNCSNFKIVIFWKFSHCEKCSFIFENIQTLKKEKRKEKGKKNGK
jgi:hypothetical protein